MTVTYLDIIPTAGWGNILQIFSIWRASLFKGVWKKLFLYCLLYTLISFTYRLIISEEEQAKQTFERFCVFCNDYQVFLPLEFILGFYITQVVIMIVKYLLTSSLKSCRVLFPGQGALTIYSINSFKICAIIGVNCR